MEDRSIVKFMVNGIMIFGLGIAIWVLGFILGCSIIQLNITVFFIYWLLLWLLLPFVVIIIYWKRLVRFKDEKLRPLDYGLLFSTSFLIWFFLSMILALGPCYRYKMIEAGFLGEAVLTVYTAPLLLVENSWEILGTFSPGLFVVIFMGIGFCVGAAVGWLKKSN